MYGGREDKRFWRRLPNPTRFQIEARAARAGRLAMPSFLGRDISTPWSSVEKLRVRPTSLRRPFLRTPRSCGIRTLAEQRLRIAAVAKRRPLPH